MPKILVCAATSTELQATRLGIRRAGLEGRFAILKTGIGPARAEKALEGFLAAMEPRERPDRIVSTGFAGSWSPDLHVSDWIDARSVRDEEGNSIELPPLAASAQGREVHLFSVAAIHRNPPPALLTGIAGGLPAAVDMESFALARVASNHAIPTSVFRYVTDSAETPLPEFITHFTRVAAPPSESESGFSCRVRSALAGARGIARDPSSLARLVHEGRQWREALISGWAGLSKELTEFSPGLR